jgi:hypothetical protein
MFNIGPRTREQKKEKEAQKLANGGRHKKVDKDEDEKLRGKVLSPLNLNIAPDLPAFGGFVPVFWECSPGFWECSPGFWGNSPGLWGSVPVCMVTGTSASHGCQPPMPTLLYFSLFTFHY